MNTWRQVRIGDVLTKADDWTEIVSGQKYKQVTVRLWGKGVVLRNEVEGSKIASRRRRRVRPGQFILSRIDARNGAFGLVPDELDGAVISNDFPSFEIKRGQLMPEYLNWMSKTRDFVALCQAASEGTTNRVRLQEDRFLAMTIPLPPLAEQQRIVARIDALAAHIEEAKGLRAEAMAEAVAVMGAAKSTVFGSHSGNGWTTCHLGDIAQIRAGTTLGRKLSDRTISLPYLRVANVQDGYFDLTEVKKVEVRESESEKWQIQSGDLLLTEGGDWDKLGRGAVWQGQIPECIHQNHIFRLRFDRSQFEPRFFQSLISSPEGKQYFQSASKQTTNLASINQRQLKAFPVRYPSLDEQRRIVAYLDDLQANVDAVKRLQEETQAELDALLPSVLDRAFRGEL